VTIVSSKICQIKVAYSPKGLSKYPLYRISLQFFLQSCCSQSKLRIWIQISTPSQSQAPDRNLEEKWKKNWISVYVDKPFWEKAKFTLSFSLNWKRNFLDWATSISKLCSLKSIKDIPDQIFLSLGLWFCFKTLKKWP